MSATNVEDFLSELGGGVFVEKLAAVLSEAALGTVLNGYGNKKGKVAIEFSMQKVGENDQVIISHRLINTTPTKRGKRVEDDTTETPFFVGKGGQLTIDQPREEESGQFGLSHQQDGVRNIRE